MWLRTLSFVLVQQDLGQARAMHWVLLNLACRGKIGPAAMSYSAVSPCGAAALTAERVEFALTGCVCWMVAAVRARAASYGGGPWLLQHRMGHPHSCRQAHLPA